MDSNDIVHKPSDYHILTIDDDDLVRESLAVFLEDTGYRVSEASGGKKGLECFRQDKPHLVLCDLRMPDVDGLQLLELMTREDANVPIIVISGAGLIHDVVEALRLGAWDFLVKPIADFGVLEHAVKNALHRSELEAENKVYREELEQANVELKKNLDLLKEDQEAGRRAQLQLLPESQGNFGQYHFSHEIIPSLYLSGDFIDYFEIDERYLGFYIADISGHGSASAFVTMMLKSLMNQPIRRYRTHNDATILNPAKLFSSLNSDILNANLGKYLTMFYGVIDREEDSIRYSNAGHYPRPVVLNANHPFIIKDKGFPIGLFDWANYQNYEIILNTNTTIGLFSDGLFEILKDPTLKSKEHLLLSLVSNHQISIESLKNKLQLAGVKDPPDDITMFLVQRKS